MASARGKTEIKNPSRLILDQPVSPALHHISLEPLVKCLPYIGKLESLKTNEGSAFDSKTVMQSTPSRGQWTTIDTGHLVSGTQATPVLQKWELDHRKVSPTTLASEQRGQDLNLQLCKLRGNRGIIDNGRVSRNCSHRHWRLWG